MGALISLPFAVYINKIVETNAKINSQWFKYLKALTSLWSQRRAPKTNRIHVHNALSDAPQDAGVLPFKHEWEYDLPSQVFHYNFISKNALQKFLNLFQRYYYQLGL